MNETNYYIDENGMLHHREIDAFYTFTMWHLRKRYYPAYLNRLYHIKACNFKELWGDNLLVHLRREELDKLRNEPTITQEEFEKSIGLKD